MSDAWRAGWVIRELKAVQHGDYTWTWLCSIEREATRTVVHVPGMAPDVAIERAWEMAKMVEDATW